MIRVRPLCVCILTAIGFTVISSGSHAEWIGSGELGAVAARGNSESNSANAKLDIASEVERWKHSLYVYQLYGSNDSVTSANRWETRWQSDYKITEPLYWFGGLRYERDHFGAFSYQQSATTGLGYKLIDNDTTKLSVQGGFGIKKSEPQTLVKDESGEVIDRINDEAVTRADVVAGVKFEHALTGNTKVLDTFLAEATSENTFIQNDLSLQVSMSEKLALSVGFGLRQNSSPPPDSKRTDTVTTLSVVYKIQ
jgi:putative salt-induced outer membrane protein